MVTDKGTAKVMDFGLAKVFGASLITKEAKTMGTVAYMSPEQAQGQSVDYRTDIWSLGVVLYEMVTGELPFGGDHKASLGYAIVHEPPRPMRRAGPKLKPELEQVVEKALEKKPADRYQSMAEFLEDLKALAEGLKPLRAKVGQTYNSIAILPLVNDSGDPNQDYFANSLTELLISELYKVAALNVASRQAVMPYKGSNKSPDEIADELRVKAIVEASVLTSENKVRLTARLWDPYKHKIIWADTLEKEYSEILILQSELCQAIVSGIRVAVTPAEKARLTTEREVVRRAYDLFLKGVDSWHTGAGRISPSENLWRSHDLFQRAIDIDPTLAVAHAWKGQMLLQLGINGHADARQVYPKAKEAALEALKIDPGLSAAHRVLGSIMNAMDWDFLGAEEETKKAIEIDPGDPIANIVYLQILVGNGKSDEAIRLLNRWISKGKKDITKRETPRAYTFLFLLAGYFKEALELQNRLISSGPNPSWYDIFLLAAAYAMNDMNSEALAQIEKNKDLAAVQENSLFQVNYAWTLGRCGRREEAKEKMEEVRAFLVKQNIDPAYYLGCIYAGLGNKDKALEYLNQAYEKHAGLMPNLISDWWLRSLHGDPRFEELAKKIGFPVIPRAISKR
jgi:TolB-like protein